MLSPVVDSGSSAREGEAPAEPMQCEAPNVDAPLVRLPASPYLASSQTGGVFHFVIRSPRSVANMPNESTDLRETLARLHEQLRGAADVNPETRALLHGVMRDIHTLLNAPPAAEGEGGAEAARTRHDESIAQRLATAEREFEATHPTLAGIVGSVIDALARMGI